MKTKLLFLVFILNALFFNAQNLVAYYPFNGNANDESENNHHGTVNGATLTTDRFGNPNSAFEFDGVDDYISIANNPSINIQTGESYSISFWVKHNAQNNAKYMISKYKGTSGEPSYAIGTGSAGDSYSWYEFSPGGIESRGSIDLNDNQWHNITSVFKSGESVTIYVDGVLDIQHPITHNGSILNSRDLTIGCGSNLAQYYNGIIDDIKIYKKALTIEEIKNETRGLVAYYPFNGNANDESGNANNGNVNGAILTTDRFGNSNSAYLFDGVDDFIQIANSNSLDIFNSDLTISMWLFNYSDSKFTYKGISKGGYDTGAGYELVFNNKYSTDGELQFNISKSARRVPSINTYNNQWVMLTATYTHATETRKTYINGVEKSFTIFNEAILKSSTSDLYIGNRAPNNNYIGFVNGKMDDIRIYNSALTATEILNLYNYNTLKVEKIEDVTNSSFYVFNNTLYFKNTQNLNEIKTIEVYNLLGQKVFETSDIQEQIWLTTLQKGIYILKVENIKGNYSTLKFIIN
jgi:hypothetical protein